MLEFGGEGLRKYDLIRWNLLETKINETRQKLTQFMNGTGAYTNVPEYIFYKNLLAALPIMHLQKQHSRMFWILISISTELQKPMYSTVLTKVLQRHQDIQK